MNEDGLTYEKVLAIYGYLLDDEDAQNTSDRRRRKDPHTNRDVRTRDDNKRRNRRTEQIGSDSLGNDVRNDESKNVSQNQSYRDGKAEWSRTLGNSISSNQPTQLVDNDGNVRSA